ncbi:unnamed protein product [Adineta ricciae]|uniref:Uncharacterized protein n=1 Tax=Adineta ricciae TaxID=249248 RepID=A0A814RSJ1_ADIRI|nr:unnamed protein product [Adineta ricciae]
MIYKDRLTPPPNWPPLVRYPNYYYPERRLSVLWFLLFAALSLVLSVIALIIVFAVESAWFHDYFESSLANYGLWRLCFFGNGTCASWFSADGTVGARVDRRLSQSKAGINAWQALEIIFLFLTTATLIITIASIVCFRVRSSLHYYLAILAVFCVWPAAIVGVSVLFVFGFAVYNVSTQPRELDWCFYVNLVAVILAVIAAILLSIYDALLKKPIKNIDDETVVETFADINAYPAALSPSTFVVVRRNKRNRHKPYSYSQTLHPSHYLPATTNRVITSEQNNQMLTPYTSITTHEANSNLQQTPSIPNRTVEYRTNIYSSPSSTTVTHPPSIPISTQYYRPPLTSYQYETQSFPSQGETLNRTVGYNSELNNDYNQHGFYNPIRTNIIEQKSEPRVLHYYTGYDYFATVDPVDGVATRHHAPSTVRPGTAIRYPSNRSYHSSDYIKSSM